MVIEIATFRLAPGADEAAFIVADGRVQTDVVPNLDGFMRRTTARNGEGDRDGEWCVVTLWWSMPQAHSGRERAAEHAVTKKFLSFVDPATVSVKLFEDLGG